MGAQSQGVRGRSSIEYVCARGELYQSADEPPALNDLISQVAAASGPKKQECECVADVSSCSAARTATVKHSSSIMKGFLNVKSRRQQKGTEQRHIHLIKPKASAAHPNIPEIFMLEPNEDVKQMEMHKKRVLGALKPTEKSIAEVMSTPDLAEGFDDPEIMQAVEEIGKNPELIQTKYAKNVRVAKFYKAMAEHVGEQLCQRGTHASLSLH